MEVLMSKDTREAMGGRPHVDNRTLLYDKYVPVGDGEVKEKAIEYLRATEEVGDQHVRTDLVESIGGSGRPCSDFTATLGSRMMVNMTSGVQENAGLCFDRHFGMPYIPGTALKGIALRAAQEASASDELVRRVFGEQDKNKAAHRGEVSFLPAYPTNKAQLDIDIITSHQNRNPIPVKFPAIAARTPFVFAVCGTSSAVDKAVVRQAAHWLRTGVCDLGVGAKTAAGYGWFEFDELAEKQRQNEARAERERVERERLAAEREKAVLDGLPDDERAARLYLRELPDGPREVKGRMAKIGDLDREEKRSICLLLKGILREMWDAETQEAAKAEGNPKKQAKSKAWKRVAAVRAVARELGVELP